MSATAMAATKVTYTVAAAFETTKGATAALQALKDAGFRPEQISMIAKDTGIEPADETVRDAEIGATGLGVLGGVAGWLLGISTLAIPVVGEVVGIGILWAALAGVGVGAAAGGIGGALIGHGLDERHAHEYEEHVRQGRSLVTFHAYEAAQVGEAKAIFERFGGTDVRSYSTGM
ncbi:MAG: hypothetical protein U0232_03150 [Thermomicrobiales bacterium]